MSSRLAAITALKEVLCRKEAAGVETLFLTKEAREVLAKGISRAVSQANRQAVAGATQGIHKAAEVVEVAQNDESMIVGLQEVAQVAPASFEGESATEQIASLQEQVPAIPAIRSLGSLHEKVIFSSGNPEADLMLITDAPGVDEEKAGSPLAGLTGGKMDQILKAMGLNREHVYLSNVCKFRPMMTRDQAHMTRKPSPEEMGVCLPFLLAEIAIVQPRVIVALGGAAAEGLLQIERASVAAMRGRFHDFKGLSLIVTYHPSFLLRAEGEEGGREVSKKRLLWEDMLLVMEKLGLPITAKQQAYFT